MAKLFTLTWYVVLLVAPSFMASASYEDRIAQTTRRPPPVFTRLAGSSGGHVSAPAHATNVAPAPTYAPGGHVIIPSSTSVYDPRNGTVSSPSQTLQAAPAYNNQPIYSGISAGPIYAPGGHAIVPTVSAPQFSPQFSNTASQPSTNTSGPTYAPGGHAIIPTAPQPVFSPSFGSNQQQAPASSNSGAFAPNATYIQSNTGAQLTGSQVQSGHFPQGTFFTESGTGRQISAPGQSPGGPSSVHAVSSISNGTTNAGLSGTHSLAPNSFQNIGGQSPPSVVGVPPATNSGMLQFTPRQSNATQIVKDTITGLPSAAAKVGGTIGNALVSSEKAVGQDISAALGANAYRQQIQQVQQQEQATYSQLVVQRNAAQNAGRDTTALDNAIKNFQFTKDDTNQVFPALNKTNGQVIKDFGGVGLDIATAGAGGATAKGVRSVDAVAGSAREAVRLGDSASSARFANSDLLADHFQKHGAQFSASGPAAYEQQASQFLAGPKTDSTLEKARSNGDIVRYDPNTNVFGVLGNNGQIRTYFKPDDGIQYFFRQSGTLQ